MASIFNFLGHDYLTVDGTVGASGTNYSGDVYLVQALLKEFFTVGIAGAISGICGTPTTIPTGSFDKATRDAIENYLKMQNTGVTHFFPTNGSIFALGTTRTLEIIQLNQDIFSKLNPFRSSKSFSLKDYIFKKYPWIGLGIELKTNIATGLVKGVK